MSIDRISLLAFSCFAIIVFASAEVSANNGHRNGAKEFSLKLKSLPWKDRAILYLANIFSPESFKGLPEEARAEISEYPYLPTIDNFFVDARQLFIQAKKISEDANLPEFHWVERYDFCFWFWCINLEIAYTTKDSKFIGAESITSSTEITPTSISNTFEIPLFNWTSPGFLVNVTDYNAREFHYNKNSYYSFENVTIAFNCDYHFVPEVGIQLENLTIYYNAGRVRGGLQEFERWDFEGNLLEKYVNDPEESPIDEYMMDHWGYYKREYTSGMQYSLNCFLSNGRSDPDGCVHEQDSYATEYYNFLNLELIQTLGLGALLSN